MKTNSTTTPPSSLIHNQLTVAPKSASLSRKRSRKLFQKDDLTKFEKDSTGAALDAYYNDDDDDSIHKASVLRRFSAQYYPFIIHTKQDISMDNSKAKNSNRTSAIVNEFLQRQKQPPPQEQQQSTAMITVSSSPNAATITTTHSDSNNSDSRILVDPSNIRQNSQSSSPQPTTTTDTATALTNSNSFSSVSIPRPQWHAPWQLSTVISSHLGWVRSIAFDPTNDMFATGSADRTIKIFDFAKACVGANDALKITLTGHISPVRGLAFSPRHPYLFSAGEDKMVKCWDLETNQVVRHYHGHLSGVFDLKLHPTLDLLVTGGRDAVARVWDMRTKHQVHCLTGHDNTVGAILTKSVDPQIITGSYDSTIKLWDLAAGKCMATLTHHKKAVRALAQPSFENTFLSGAADMLKKWQAKEGRFIQNLSGHKAVINALAINDDGVVVSGADNGSMNFWDYKTGYCFQKTETVAQPGSLDAENGIYAASFDMTGTRLVTGEADKTIKIWKMNEEASEMTHPIDFKGWRKKCLTEARQRK
jgi:pleiotropic regulator 1